jgi:hypothetical protein
MLHNFVLGQEVMDGTPARAKSPVYIRLPPTGEQLHESFQFGLEMAEQPEPVTFSKLNFRKFPSGF